MIGHHVSLCWEYSFKLDYLVLMRGPFSFFDTKLTYILWEAQVWFGWEFFWHGWVLKEVQPPVNSFVFSLHSGLCFLCFGRGKSLFLSSLYSTPMLSACTRCLHPAYQRGIYASVAAKAGLFLSCSNTHIQLGKECRRCGGFSGIRVIAWESTWSNPWISAAS